MIFLPKVSLDPTKPGQTKLGSKLIKNFSYAVQANPVTC